MNQWLSFTTTRVAPAATAPSTAALASAVMRRRKRAYSAAQAGSVGSVWDSWTTPATPGGLELSASDGRGWPAHGGAVAGGAVAGAPGNVAAAVRDRVRDRRRVLGPHRPRDGGLLHDLRRRGAARTGRVGKLVDGGRIRWAAHGVRHDHCPEVRWLDRE